MSTIDTQLLSQETQTLLQSLSQDDFFDDPARYDLLMRCVIDHNHLYYIDNNPIIADREYDQLFDALKHFETLHPSYISKESPTQSLREQYDIQTEFKKSHHQVAVLSLQNTYNSQDILDWSRSIATMLHKKLQDNPLEDLQEQFRYILEPKYDGLSIVLTYEYGKLVKAVTRGDGYTGDDVSANVMTIQNLPKQLADHTDRETIIVRGEIVMKKSTLQQLNQERESTGDTVFSNTRNAAA